MMVLKIEDRFVVFSHNLREVVIICPLFYHHFLKNCEQTLNDF